MTADTPLLAAVGADVYADLLDGPDGTFAADGKVRGFEVTESTRLSQRRERSTAALALARLAFTPAVDLGSVEPGDWRGVLDAVRAHPAVTEARNAAETLDERDATRRAVTALVIRSLRQSSGSPCDGMDRTAMV